MVEGVLVRVPRGCRGIKPCENFDDNGTSPFFNRSSNGCVFIFMLVFGGCNPKTVRFLPGNAVRGPHDLLCVYVFSCAADVTGWNTFLPFQNDNSTNYFPTELCVVSTRITERASVFAFESPCI